MQKKIKRSNYPDNDDMDYYKRNIAEPSFGNDDSDDEQPDEVY